MQVAKCPQNFFYLYSKFLWSAVGTVSRDVVWRRSTLSGLNSRPSNLWGNMTRGTNALLETHIRGKRPRKKGNNASILTLSVSVLQYLGFLLLYLSLSLASLTFLLIWATYLILREERKHFSRLDLHSQIRERHSSHIDEMVEKKRQLYVYFWYCYMFCVVDRKRIWHEFQRHLSWELSFFTILMAADETCMLMLIAILKGPPKKAVMSNLYLWKVS